METKYTIHTDGGARGNPGPAACAFVVSSGDEVVFQRGWYIGETTNNQAEYQAVHGALTWATEHQAKEVHIVSDSELIVKQLRGEYKVKNKELAPWHQKVLLLARQFPLIDFTVVKREKNVEADALVNETLDAQ